MGETRWTDLLDPSIEEIERAAGFELGAHERALLDATADPRPALYGMDGHAVGVFVVAVAVPDEDRVYYQQAKVAQDQNEIVKRLTVIASLLLLPTFIVGVYGQNFHRMPELGWHYGYEFSWALIVGSTIAQLAFFRWKKWI